MSIEELKADHASVTAKLRGMNPALTTAPELCAFLQQEFMPLHENLIGELAEMDETVQDIYTGAEDILQPETGGQLAAVITTAAGMLEKAMAILPAGNLETAKLKKAYETWKPLCKEALEAIDEITIPADDVEEGDDDEEDEGDDASEDDADAEAEKGAK